MECSKKRTLSRIALIALSGISIAFDISRIARLVLDEQKEQEERENFE